mgnify:CR=1 FL=1
MPKIKTVSEGRIYRLIMAHPYNKIPKIVKPPNNKTEKSSGLNIFFLS